MSTSLFQIPKNTAFTYGAPKVPNVNSSNSTLEKARNVFGTTVNAVKDVTIGGKSQYVMYFFSIIVVLFAILMFIHYFITPIWQLNPGGPGIIPIPGLSDSKVYWTNLKDQRAIPDISSNIGVLTSNWSMALDVFVAQPYSQDSKPRIIFARCNQGDIHPASSILISESISNYNIAIGIIPNTNDLIVSSTNTDNTSEDVIVPNIPVQKPFRVGVVLFDQMMEVYINGMLYKTRQFSAPVLPARGIFMPKPSDNVQSTVIIKNLILWNRRVMPNEMRYAKPSLADAASFSASSMTSNTCPGIEFNQAAMVSTTQNAASTASAAITSVMNNTL